MQFLFKQLFLSINDYCLWYCGLHFGKYYSYRLYVCSIEPSNRNCLKNSINCINHLFNWNHLPCSNLNISKQFLVKIDKQSYIRKAPLSSILLLDIWPNFRINYCSIYRIHYLSFISTSQILS